MLIIFDLCIHPINAAMAALTFRNDQTRYRHTVMIRSSISILHEASLLIPTILLLIYENVKITPWDDSLNKKS